MKNICLPFFVLSIAFVFQGCTKNNNGTSNDASVMFVNGCSGAGGVDVKVNGKAPGGPSGIGYFANSGYQYLVANTNLNIDFYQFTQGNLLCNSTQNFTAKDHYSVFTGGLDTGPSFVVTTDDFPTLTGDSAAVRFINLSSDSLNESFSIDAQKVDSNVGYTICTPFSKIAAASNVPINSVDPAYTQPAYQATITNATFAAGKIYTVMLTGSHNAIAKSTGILTLTVISNN